MNQGCSRKRPGLDHVLDSMRQGAASILIFTRSDMSDTMSMTGVHEHSTTNSSDLFRVHFGHQWPSSMVTQSSLLATHLIVSIEVWIASPSTASIPPDFHLL